jgi:hypothetical protein
VIGKHGPWKKPKPIAKIKYKAVTGILNDKHIGAIKYTIVAILMMHMYNN